MNIIEKFRADIESFLEKTGTSRTGLGIDSLADPSFMRNLDEGRSPSAKTMQKVYDYMERSL